MKTLALLLVPIPFFLITGCSGGDPAHSGGAAPQLLPLDKAAAALTAKESIQSAFDALEEALEAVDDSELVPPVAEKVHVAEALIELLETYVMVDEQLVVDDGKTVTWALSPDHFCKWIEGDGGCAEWLVDHPAWVEFTSISEGHLTIRVLLGVEKTETMVFQLGPNSVTGEVDLGAIAQGVDELDAQGRIAAGVHITSDAVSLVGKVVQSVSIDAEGASVTVGKGMVVVTADGDEISLFVDSGAVLATLPYQWIVDGFAPETCWSTSELEPEWECEKEPTPQVEGSMSFSIPAITGGGAYDKAAQAITVNQASMGGFPATATRDGITLVSAGFEPVAGSLIRIDGGVQAVIDGVLEAKVALSLASIAADFESVKGWMHDEVLDLFVGGASQPAVTFYDEPNVTSVEAGTLRIDSKAFPADSLEVWAGACLASTDEEQPGAHPLLSRLVVVSCP